MQIEAWLLEILACPECHAPLRVDEDASELVCTSDTCGLAYPVRDDIPVLLVEQNARLALDMSSDAYVLEVGRVAVSGASADLRGNESVRRSYLGY